MDDTDMVDDVDVKDISQQHPLGKQMLDRTHDDHSILLKDYDEMMPLLENEHVKNHMTKHMQTMAKFLDDTERLHAKHYKDYPPIPNSMDEDEKDMDGAEEETEEEPSSDEVVEADSEEEDLPTAEEAVQGMSNKQLRILRKALEDEEDKRIKGMEDDDEKKCKALDDDEDTKALTGDELGDVETDLHDVADELSDDAADTEPHQKALEDHEMSKVGEAAQFAKDLANEQNFDETHRQKSYHFHKAMDEIANPMKSFAPMDKQDTVANVIEPGEMGEKSDPAMDQSKLGTEGLGVEGGAKPGFEEYKDMHPHRKACKSASDQFGQLAQEKAFGEQHREMAAELGKALDAVAQSTQGTEDLGIEDGAKPGFEEYKDLEEEEDKAFPEVDKQDNAAEVPEKKRFRLKKDMKDDEDEKRLKRKKAMEDEEEKKLRRKKALADKKEEKDMDDEEEKSIVKRNGQKTLPPAKVKALEKAATAQREQVKKLDELVKTLLISRN